MPHSTRCGDGGKEAIRRYVAGAFAIPDFAISWTTDRVWVAKSGDIAYATGTTRVSMTTPEGKRVVGCRLALRARPEVHKRLMLLAAVTLLAPAVARIVLLFAHGPAPQFLAFYTCIAGCVLVDTLWYRRLHPVLGWGALTIVAAFQLSYLAVKTPAWMALVPS